jgi:adenylate kinase
MTLFVAGVHAVGKTYILQPVCERLGFKHATASQLIKEQKGLANWSMSRQVGDIDENQRALLAAVERLQAEGPTLVLDGHFVLRRSPHVHEAIRADIFQQLKLHGVLLLEASPQVLIDRLAGRGDTSWCTEELEAFAAFEKAHATQVCEAMQIPLQCLNMPTVEQAIQAFRALAP